MSWDDEEEFEAPAKPAVGGEWDDEDASDVAEDWDAESGDDEEGKDKTQEAANSSKAKPNKLSKAKLAAKIKEREEAERAAKRAAMEATGPMDEAAQRRAQQESDAMLTMGVFAGLDTPDSGISIVGPAQQREEKSELEQLAVVQTGSLRDYTWTKASDYEEFGEELLKKLNERGRKNEHKLLLLKKLVDVCESWNLEQVKDLSDRLAVVYTKKRNERQAASKKKKGGKAKAKPTLGGGKAVARANDFDDDGGYYDAYDKW